jgi:hypothetical protein
MYGSDKIWDGSLHQIEPNDVFIDSKKEVVTSSYFYFFITQFWKRISIRLLFNSRV